MSDIVLVTPPDKFPSTEYSFLLIYPSSQVKEQFQELITKFDTQFTVYLYSEEENHNYEWLIDTFHKADCVIFDMDNSESEILDLAGYFLAKRKTFWLTKGSALQYTSISKNKIYGLDYLVEYLGGQVEK
jgi:hypothetical protein